MMKNQAKRGAIKALTMAFGIATVLGISAGVTPASAHGRDHGRGYHHGHHQRGWDHGRHKRHDRDRYVVRERYYYAPPRYYAPPPVYYAPTPGYYYDSSPNVTFGLSLGF